MNLKSIKYIIYISFIISSTITMAGDIYTIQLNQNNESIIDRRLYVDDNTPFASNRTYAYHCKDNQSLDKTNTLYLKVEESQSKIKYFFYTNSKTFKKNDCSLNNTTHLLQSGEITQLPLNILIYNNEQENNPYQLLINKK